jgi:hypothetical protein
VVLRRSASASARPPPSPKPQLVRQHLVVDLRRQLFTEKVLEL